MSIFPSKNLVILTVLTLSGCATAPLSTLSWDKTADAAKRAAMAPETWGPLAGAAVIAAADRDHAWQDSLHKHQPIFGSNAEDASNNLKSASTALYAVTTVFAQPAESSTQEALEWKALNVATYAVSREVTDGIVNTTKEWSGRDTPNGQQDDAFPSSHAAITTLQTGMARRNLDYINMNDNWRVAAKAGLYTIDGLEALSRVEADKHYPTDVLVGMALGNFISNFAFNLLLDRPSPLGVGNLALIPTGDGALLQYTAAW